MATSYDVAQTLVQGVLADHPTWEQYAVPYGPADDPEAEPRSVRFSIPAPKEPAHRLEILQRGNTIEVAYDRGAPSLRTERQFIFDDGEAPAAVAEVRAFVNRLCEG